jgi:hypothetical protein
MLLRHAIPFTIAVLVATALTACSGTNAEQPSGDPVPTATPAPIDPKKNAESRLFTSMKPAMVEYVRAQPWFAEVTLDEYRLIEELRAAGQTAQKHGTEPALMSLVRLAADQPWAQDDLDEQEAKGFKAVLEAYQEGLEDRYEIDVSMALPSTLKGAFFKTVPLPESGEVTVLVSSDVERLGPQAFSLAVETLPKVESIVGKYPYPFLFIWITSLDGYAAGLSRDEFIWIDPADLDVDTMAHEMTHATVYGIFPTWFEEGFAYFMGFFHSGSMEAREREFRTGLASNRLDTRLDLNARFGHSLETAYISSLAQGFLFFKGIYDIEGFEGMGKIIRALRSKTFGNDNELVREITANGRAETRDQLRQFVCANVTGLRSPC